jgi:hypothetical protein
VSEAAWAASAAAAGLVAAALMCAVALAAAWAAWSNRAARSAAVSRAGAGRVPGACRAGCHRWVSLGQVRSAASLPPEYQTGLPSLVVSPGKATAYPVTCPGIRVLCRWRTVIPAASRQAKNSAGLTEAAAAVVTARRKVTRGASSSPCRAVFSSSGRVG